MTTRAGTLPNRRNLATRRLAVVAVAVAAFAMGVACDPVGVDQRVAYPASGAGATPNNQAIHDLLTLVNLDRAANGMRALAWDDQLGGLAATWSSHMVETGVFAHRDLAAVLASSPYAGWHTLGENILVGDCRLTAAAMETAWMASPRPPRQHPVGQLFAHRHRRPMQLGRAGLGDAGVRRLTGSGGCGSSRAPGHTGHCGHFQHHTALSPPCKR